MSFLPNYLIGLPVRVYPESPKAQATIRRAHGVAPCSLCGERRLEAAIIVRPSETIRVCRYCASSIRYLAHFPSLG